jgi:hypothetical protein
MHPGEAAACRIVCRLTARAFQVHVKRAVEAPSADASLAAPYTLILNSHVSNRQQTVQQNVDVVLAVSKTMRVGHRRWVDIVFTIRSRRRAQEPSAMCATS